jgi:AhpD family alkylhydroperoxidase
MEPRIVYTKFSPDAFEAFKTLEKHVHSPSLGETLLNLVKMRASQINGDVYCLDIYSKTARACGETEQRLYVLNAWREAPYYTPRERAALEWTESLTLIAQNRVPDEIFEHVVKEFTVQELVDLTYAVIAVNGWNRLSISMRAIPGQYPEAYSHAQSSGS